MPETYRRRNGLDFPLNWSDVYIDLVCWKKWKEAPYTAGKYEPHECWLRAMPALLPKEAFTISRWTEEHAWDWTHESFMITWGCASSSKSNDYGLLTLTDWMIDPNDTIAIMASTTKAMLKLRSFESVTRYFKLLRKHPDFIIPGKIAKSLTAIINDDEIDDTSTEKASIRGVAVAEGTEDESRANLQGAHLPYVRLVLDELSQMKPSVMAVRTNLAIGARDFKLVGLTNIDSLYDLAGQFSVPINGWASVGPDTDEWRTQWGKVRRHDGLKSPAITEPDGEKKYPYLLTKPVLDEIIKQENNNWDAPQVWTMVRAWPPAEGKKISVLTESEIANWHMQERGTIKWERTPTLVGGLDPAFVSGGDNCILQLADVGRAVDGRFMIEFRDPIIIDIAASSGVPAIYQISNKVKEIASFTGLTPQYLAVDDSGTQSVADVLDREWGAGCIRVSFGAKPSDMPVSDVNPQLESQRYKNVTTALWFSMREFGAKDQIRGLGNEAAKEFTLRGLKSATVPIQLLSKTDIKKLIHKSPDHADAAALALAPVRYRLNIFPGSSRSSPSGKFLRWFDRSVAQRFDLDSREGAYSSPDIQ